MFFVFIMIILTKGNKSQKNILYCMKMFGEICGNFQNLYSKNIFMQFLYNTLEQIQAIKSKVDSESEE